MGTREECSAKCTVSLIPLTKWVCKATLCTETVSTQSALSCLWPRLAFSCDALWPASCRKQGVCSLACLVLQAGGVLTMFEDIMAFSYGATISWKNAVSLNVVFAPQMHTADAVRILEYRQGSQAQTFGFHRRSDPLCRGGLHPAPVLATFARMASCKPSCSLQTSAAAASSSAKRRIRCQEIPGMLLAFSTVLMTH